VSRNDHPKTWRKPDNRQKKEFSIRQDVIDRVADEIKEDVMIE